MNEKNIFQTLNEYMQSVFDSDGDGIVSIKELFGAFPNMAIPIAIAFVDVLVMAAEYRVWEFGYYITGDPILAVGFVLVSAVPFLLGQLFWLYPRATFFQKGIAIGFVVMSLYTSAYFGLADLTREYDNNGIYEFLVKLTAGYIVATLLYILIDPTIKMMRMKKKAMDASLFERQKQDTAKSILTNLRETLNLKRDLERDFGSQEVAQALAQLSGGKKKQPQQTVIPARQFASDTQDENPTPGSAQPNRPQQ